MFISYPYFQQCTQKRGQLWPPYNRYSLQARTLQAFLFDWPLSC